MDLDHPTPEELEGLALGSISTRRARTVILHLLRGCEDCLQVLLPYVPARFLPESLEVPPSPFHADDYDAPIDRAFSLLGASLPNMVRRDIQRETVELLAEGGLEALADAPPEISGIPLFEALLERSWALRYDDPAQMVQLACAAALQASQLDESEIGEKKAADLRCRAWTELANAYRVADELDQADHALSEAVYFLNQGSCNDLLGARFFTVFASQQAALRRFDLACETLDMVTAVYRRQGDHHLYGRTMIARSIFVGYSGNAEAAVLGIQQGLMFIDEQREPMLVFSALQSQIRFLVDSGKFNYALRAFEDLKRRDLVIGSRISLMKLRWLEGQIYVGLKDFDLADQALREVKQGFDEAGLGYKAALAGLELGAVWFQQGSFDRAEDIVLECADVFLALGIGRELAASLLVVRKAAESRYLSLTTLQKVIDLLHKEERGPRAAPPDEP